MEGGIHVTETESQGRREAQNEVTQPRENVQKKRKTEKPKNIENVLIEKATEMLADVKNSRSDESSPFGKMVSEKLAKLEDFQRIMCEKLINDAIFYRSLNQLKYESKIVI